MRFSARYAVPTKATANIPRCNIAPNLLPHTVGHLGLTIDSCAANTAVYAKQSPPGDVGTPPGNSNQRTSPGWGKRYPTGKNFVTEPNSIFSPTSGTGPTRKG